MWASDLGVEILEEFGERSYHPWQAPPSFSPLPPDPKPERFEAEARKAVAKFRALAVIEAQLPRADIRAWTEAYKAVRLERRIRPEQKAKQRAYDQKRLKNFTEEELRIKRQRAKECMARLRARRKEERS